MDAIYARQSVDKKDSISIETQIEHCKKELTNASDFAVYSDKGYSGSNLLRPEFQHMLSDIKSGKIGRIVTYRLDRISRSVLDFANLIDLFDRHGVSFSSTQEKFDTSTPMGKAMLNITMVFAQLERETIQTRIRDNYYSRGEKGMYLGGPAPFGFKKITVEKTKMLTAEPGEARALERMYRMYGNDLMTLGAVARALNEEGVASPGGSRWDSGKVSRVLRNPVSVIADIDIYNYYRGRGCRFTNELSDFALGKGCYLYGKREGNERKYTDVSNHTLSLAPHDGIIESALFLRCQERLDGNRQIDNRKASTLTWLTGLLKCGECGYSVIPKSSNKGCYTYLYCTGRTNTGCCEIRGNLGALRDVEEAVRERVFKWAERYSDLSAAVEETRSRERRELLCKIAGLDTAIEKLLDLAVEANDVTAKYLNERLEKLEEEKRELGAAMDQLPENVSAVREISALPREWDNLSVARKNAVASLLISKLAVLKGEIEIEWKYDFDI